MLFLNLSRAEIKTYMVAVGEQAQTQEQGWRREGEGREEEQEGLSIPREEESTGAVMSHISIKFRF